MGGDYLTWFDDKDSELRALFYKLENQGIVKFCREKKEDGSYFHGWKLTKKGKEIFDKDEKILELLRTGHLTEAYNRIIKQI